MKNRVAPILRYVFENFLVPILFFIVYRNHGAKPAITVALGVTAAQIIFFRVRRIPLSPIFISMSALTLVSGAVDLSLREPVFFKFSPAAQNLLVVLALTAAWLKRLPVVEWFSRGLPSRFQPDFSSLPPSYPRRVTALFIFYFLAKAAVYLYLAFAVNLGELVLLRSIVGPVSFALVVLAEERIRKTSRL